MWRKNLTKEEKIEVMKSRPCPCRVIMPPGKMCMYRAYTPSELAPHENKHKEALERNQKTPARYFEKDIENKYIGENTIKLHSNLVIKPAWQSDAEDPYTNYEYLDEYFGDDISTSIFTFDETVTVAVTDTEITGAGNTADPNSMTQSANALEDNKSVKSKVEDMARIDNKNENSSPSPIECSRLTEMIEPIEGMELIQVVDQSIQDEEIQIETVEEKQTESSNEKIEQTQIELIESDVSIKPVDEKLEKIQPSIETALFGSSNISSIQP